jgi:hypothetical protein
LETSVAKLQALTRNVVEYAFADLLAPTLITITRKFELKKELRQERNQELGRKLKRCMNSLISSKDRFALCKYLENRLAYDNAVITMILLLAADEPNALLQALSNTSGPFTSKQIQSMLDRPAITDVNKRLNEFVRFHNDNIILHLPSERRIHLKKERSENGRELSWRAQIFDPAQWIHEKVNSITFVYPSGFDIQKFVKTAPSVANAIANFAPKTFYAESTNNSLDVYFAHDDYVSHSRYFVDRHGVAKIFELRPLQDGII